MGAPRRARLVAPDRHRDAGRNRRPRRRSGRPAARGRRGTQEAYRAVEYGQYDPGDHVAAVERAIEVIERSVEPGADEGGGDAA
ncbi:MULTISPECIES: hypothetical protein [Haloarcula]|uniref:hypothetical protein n=1 Tax=Haloarcula TaxID=2237 RepID=UPI0023E80359|nr:hypothetical protein [Halomicroarcula sp. SHR3]